MFIAIGLKAQAFNLFIHLPSAASALTTRNKPTKQWFFCFIKNENTKKRPLYFLLQNPSCTFLQFNNLS